MDIDVKDPKFLRWVGAVLVVVVALPMYFMTDTYSFTWGARGQVLVDLMARHMELSRDLEKARLLVQNLDRVEREYEILSEQWEVAQTLLPEENEMPDLLRKVTAAGQQSGIEFELFRPKEKIPQGFYMDNPVEIRVAGGYHQTGVFLSRLANLDRIVNVSRFKMQGYDSKADNPFTVKMDFVLTAYTQGPGSTVVPAGQAGQTASNQQTDGNQIATASTGH